MLAETSNNFSEIRGSVVQILTDSTKAMFLLDRQVEATKPFYWDTITLWDQYIAHNFYPIVLDLASKEKIHVDKLNCILQDQCEWPLNPLVCN